MDSRCWRKLKSSEFAARFHDNGFPSVRLIMPWSLSYAVKLIEVPPFWQEISQAPQNGFERSDTHWSMRGSETAKRGLLGNTRRQCMVFESSKLSAIPNT